MTSGPKSKSELIASYLESFEQWAQSEEPALWDSTSADGLREQFPE